MDSLLDHDLHSIVIRLPILGTIPGPPDSVIPLNIGGVEGAMAIHRDVAADGGGEGDLVEGSEVEVGGTLIQDKVVMVDHLMISMPTTVGACLKTLGGTCYHKETRVKK